MQQLVLIVNLNSLFVATSVILKSISWKRESNIVIDIVFYDPLSFFKRKLYPKIIDNLQHFLPLYGYPSQHTAITGLYQYSRKIIYDS